MRRIRRAIAALAGLFLAGCHAGPEGYGLLPDKGAPYTAARPAYPTPPPIKPLYISGYAGRRPPVARPRVVVPVEPAPAAEPGLLP